jgi:hypothetical protein
MKNVYITLNKRNVKHQQIQNDHSPNLLQKNNQSTNQSYFNEAGENQKYSTLYLQKKLKNISE